MRTFAEMLRCDASWITGHNEQRTLRDLLRKVRDAG
ncbi:MAG: hypothetical protein QOH79_2114 [Acidimicrobiaceae bacterium]